MSDEVRVCEAGCGQVIVPPGRALLHQEDMGTPDEYVGWLHPECKAERVEIMGEIADLLGIPHVQ